MTTNSELSNEEKVGLLRSLCQGDGVRPETFVEKETELRSLVDANADQIRRMFDRAAEAMTPGKYKDAFLNALWAREDMNLTERRTEFLAKEGDITYRTLVRHEQEGAEVFLKFLEAEARSSSSPYRLEEEEDDLNVDLQALRIRVARLESIITVLHDSLYEANNMISHLLHDDVDDERIKKFHKNFNHYATILGVDGKFILDSIHDMPGYFEIESGKVPEHKAKA